MMELLPRLWGHVILVVIALTITTLDIFGIPTQGLWLEMLPLYREMFGLGMLIVLPGRITRWNIDAKSAEKHPAWFVR